MRAAGMNDAVVRAFKHSYEALVAGQSGMFPESSIRPVEQLPRYEDLAPGEAGRALLAQALVMKLNGGLGTGMGLERAKSLLPVKDGLTFLDFIVRQLLHFRREHGQGVRFMLMNSVSTSRDTLEFLRRYPEIGVAAELELLQNAVPKVDAKTFAPARWPANPQLEWCPPGHGDLYSAILGSGTLARLLGQGVRFMFVSNSDNLGASVDPRLLTYFAGAGKPVLMEVAERTPADRKGGHLAARAGKLILREAAQCPAEDMPAFQDLQRHRFFNTNNLWIRLDALRDLLEANAGFVPLPMIRNAKTVDPRDKHSPAVYQLETAMGAAIECFEGAGAILVPRTRFAPVKTTSDLLALRSDAYAVTPDWRLALANTATAQPPAIDLDSAFYKLTDDLDRRTANGIPSLRECRELVVRGPVDFTAKARLAGTVRITNPSREPKPLPAGAYRDCEVNL